LVSPDNEEAPIEDKTEDATIQRPDDTASDDLDPESPDKYLLDEDLEELE
jgi:hypothetical protein